MPRWGKVGKQKIEDAGTLYPKRMETVDDEIRDLAIKFMDKAKKDGKPFFVWLNPTRMHIVTHLSPKYEAMRNSENGWSEEEAGMAQLDDDIGLVMKKLKDMGEDDNTIVVFTTDNGTEVFTWPDGGTTPFAQSKGTVMEGGFRVPAILRWPGHVPADSVQNGIFSGLDWLPDLRRRGRQSEHHRGVAEGQEDRRPDLQEPSGRLQPDGRHHRQGSVRAPRDLLPRRKHGRRGAHRRLQVPLHRPARRAGWARRPTSDVPYITNLRLDPFERTGWPNNGTKEGAQQYFDWFKYQFWRFVFVQQVMGKETPDLPRLPADAARRELQPRRGQGGDGEEDGPGRGGVQGHR